MTNLAQKLTKYREEQGLSQKALAEKADVPQSSISRIETGLLTNPGIVCLQKLAVALNISISDLTS